MYGWLCQKARKLGVGMAVCRQGMIYKGYTSNPIPTFFFIPDMILQAMHAIRMLRIAVQSKNDVGMGLLVLSLNIMSCLHTAIPTVVFGIAISTSFNILKNVFVSFYPVK